MKDNSLVRSTLIFMYILMVLLISGLARAEGNVEISLVPASSLNLIMD